MSITKDNIETKLRDKVKVFTESIWSGKVCGRDINAWLNNFDSEIIEPFDARLNALYMLSKFMYFGNVEVRELLKSLFRDKVKYPIVEKIRKDNNDTTDVQLINQLFEDKISKTRFIGVGNPSESGMHLLYYFRQENYLPKINFINTYEIFSNNSNGLTVMRNLNIINYVFIDDFCGSGSQVLKEGTKEVVETIKRLRTDVRVIYLSLFALDSGLDNIRKNTLFDNVDSVFVLDESFKCFEETSRYFKERYPGIDKDFCKKICSAYMRKSSKKKFRDPLGFNRSQLLLGFFHNTPNNTLPIMWQSRNPDWYPIFRRYPKIYGD